MRSALALFAMICALPLSAQQSDTLGSIHRINDANDIGFAAYRDQPFQAIRAGEVRAAGFLTEMHGMASGVVLGSVDPSVFRSTQAGEVAMPGKVIGLQPPAGVTWQRGDTVLLARVTPGPAGWGDIVIPTGLARIGERSPRQTLATVITVYGLVRPGQLVLPLEAVATSGRVAAAPVTGPSGQVITARQPRELQQVGSIMFIDVGRSAGIKLGDFIQVRRHAGPRTDAPDTIDDLVAVAQVVHVSEKSSAIKMVRIIDPNIRPGAPVVRVATLPG